MQPQRDPTGSPPPPRPVPAAPGPGRALGSPASGPPVPRPAPSRSQRATGGAWLGLLVFSYAAWGLFHNGTAWLMARACGRLPEVVSLDAQRSSLEAGGAGAAVNPLAEPAEHLAELLVPPAVIDAAVGVGLAVLLLVAAAGICRGSRAARIGGVCLLGLKVLAAAASTVWMVHRLLPPIAEALEPLRGYILRSEGRLDPGVDALLRADVAVWIWAGGAVAALFPALLALLLLGRTAREWCAPS